MPVIMVKRTIAAQIDRKTVNERLLRGLGRLIIVRKLIPARGAIVRGCVKWEAKK
jgi:hypothetical protein